jgi:hypothetical protein
MAMVGWCVLAEWAFAKWWIDNEIGKKEGKFYGGVVAADSTELGFWSAAAAQTHLSVASLAQLLVRQHTGRSELGDLVSLSSFLFPLRRGEGGGEMGHGKLVLMRIL